MPEDIIAQPQGSTNDPQPTGTPAGDQGAGTAAGQQPAADANANPQPGGQPAGQPRPAAGQPSGDQGGNRQLRERFERELSTRNTAIQQLRDQNAQMQRQLQALTGVTSSERGGSVEPEDVQALRQQIETLYPSLKYLREKGQDLFQFLDRLQDEMPNVTEFQNQHWESLAHDTVRSVNEAFLSAYGYSESEFNERAQRQLWSNFKEFVQESQENTARYMRRDPSLVRDFINDMQGGLLSRPRIQQNAGIINRGTASRLPRGGVTSSPVGSPPPAKPKNIDEAVSAFDALLGQ